MSEWQPGKMGSGALSALLLAADAFFEEILDHAGELGASTRDLHARGLATYHVMISERQGALAVGIVDAGGTMTPLAVIPLGGDDLAGAPIH